MKCGLCHLCTSVIIHYLYIRETLCVVVPIKTYAPLIVDTNAELPIAVALQTFKAISWQLSNIRKPLGRLQLIQLQTANSFNALVSPDTLS